MKLNARTVHWLRIGRAGLYRRLSEKYLSYSARNVRSDDPVLTASLRGARRLVDVNGDAALPADLVVYTAQRPTVERLERDCAPGALCIVEIYNQSNHGADRFLEEVEQAGFDREFVLYFGFFARLLTLPLRLLGVRPTLDRPPNLAANALLRFLLRFEIPMHPYVRFLTGECIVVVLRRPEPAPAATRDLSFVIPAYNEAERLPGYLETIQAYVARRGIDAEVLVVDDGSRDETATLAAAFAGVRVVPLYRNFGKGGAVREGVRLACGERILISDADGATPIEELEKLTGWLDRGKDIAIGSRYMEDSRVEIKQDATRILISRVGNLMIRVLTGLSFKDTQCGFKLFRRVAAQALFRNLRNLRFGFDFEVLKYARDQAFSVIEVPVRWRDQAGSKIRPRDTLNVFWELLRLRFGYFFKFSFVGVLNTLVDYTVHIGLSETFGSGDTDRQTFYQGCGFIVANVISYVFNSGFTFRARGAYWKFLLISLITFLLALASYHALNAWLNPDTEKMIAYLLKLSTVTISFFTNYFGYKLLVYRIR